MKNIIRNSSLTIILMACLIGGSSTNAFASTYGTLVNSGTPRHDFIAQGYVVDCVYNTIYGNYQVTLRGTYCPLSYRF